jgi:hypothetical protein
MLRQKGAWWPDRWAPFLNRKERGLSADRLIPDLGVMRVRNKEVMSMEAAESSA